MMLFCLGALFLLLLYSVKAEGVQGCIPKEVFNNGFDVTFYRYTNKDRVGYETNFFSSEVYKELGEFEKASGVTKINFYGGDYDFDDVQTGTIYGKTITSSNFSMVLTGYFLAAESGDYKFTAAADDGVAVALGAGSGECCGEIEDNVQEGFQIEAWKANTVEGSTGVTTTTVTLVEGVYYPITIIYFNALTQWIFSLNYTMPSGDISLDYSNVYQIQLEENICPTSSSSISTTHTTTTVTVPTDSEHTVPGTFTPGDCDDEATCTVTVISTSSSLTPMYPNLTLSTITGTYKSSIPPESTLITTEEVTSSKIDTVTSCQKDNCEVLIPTDIPAVTTITKASSTTITITYCLYNDCKITTSTGIISVVTTTHNGKKTTYTTICSSQVDESSDFVLELESKLPLEIGPASHVPGSIATSSSKVNVDLSQYIKHSSGLIGTHNEGSGCRNSIEISFFVIGLAYLF